MITTGIIKQVNISGEGYTSNLCIVEVSIFNSAADSKDYKADLIATICLPNGINDDYKVGDLVYISFVNNQYKYPVVLGKIYKGIDDTNSGSYKVTSLNVSDKTELSKDTKIGDITYDDLLKIKSEHVSDVQINASSIVDNEIANILVDSTPTQNSKHLITSSGVYNATYNKVYRSIADVSSSLTPSSTMIDLINAMNNYSILVSQVGSYTGMLPAGVDNRGVLEVCRAQNNNRAVGRYTVGSASDSKMWYGEYHTSGNVPYFEWREIATASDIPTISQIQNNGTTTVPSDKLLTESSFAKVYRRLADLSSSLTTTSTLAEICNAFDTNSSIAIFQPAMNLNLAPSQASTTLGTTMIYCSTVNRIVVEFTTNTGERWLCGYHKDSATLYPWKKVDVIDNIAMRGVDSNVNYGGYFRVAVATLKNWYRGAKARIYIQDVDGADWAILDVMPWLSGSGVTTATRIIVSQGEAASDFRNRFFLVIRQDKSSQTGTKLCELWYKQTASFQRITATFMVDISDTRNVNIINKKWEKYNVASSTEQAYVAAGTVDLTNGFIPTASWSENTFITTDYPDVDIYSENGQVQFIGQYFATKNTSNAYSDTPENATNRAVYFYDKNYTDIAGINAMVGKSWNGLNFYLRSKGNITRNIEFVHYPTSDTWNFDCTTDNSVNLGTTTRRWKNLYLAGNVSDGTNSEDISDLISEAIDLTGQTIDLNDLNFSIGFPNHRRYVCKTSGGSANITNKPIPDYAFVLDVELVRWAGSKDYITKQTLWGTDKGDVLWIRTCQNGTWGAWFANPYRKMIPICATDGATQAKVVNQPNYTLTTGNMISVYFLASNTVANPTLNVNGTGAKPIYINNAPATASNLKAGWHTFYYNGANYYTGTVFNGLTVGSAEGAMQVRQNTNIVAGEAITANRLIYSKDDNKYYVLGASATINTILPVLYANSAINSGAAGNNNWVIRNQSAAYMLGNGSAVTLTAYAPVFLKGVLTGHTFTLASSEWWTQTIPTSDDGFQYMLLGYAYSTTSIRLYSEHQIYAYQNGAFQIYTYPEAKNYYNLGIYDTYVSNGDGTATITRKTEYVYNYNIKTYGINGAFPYANFYIIGNFEIPSSVPFSAESNKGGIQIYNASAGEIDCRREDGQVFENYEELQDFINGLVIQYEITNSYTEIVIENQPLNILDQNGSQWLREEYKKSITDPIIHESSVNINTLHPIGSVFITTDSTSPAELFANTTWEKITDKFLVGAGNLYEVGTTGGSVTHKHNEGTLGAEVTISSTNVIINTVVQEDGYNYNPIAELTTTERKAYPYGQNYITPVIGNTGESNSLPPYIAVNIWKRVA